MLDCSHADAGFWKTLANIFISFVGAGILTLPHAFAKSGLLLGGGFLIFLALLTYYCILLLLDCKKILEHRGAVRCCSFIKVFDSQCKVHGNLLLP